MFFSRPLLPPIKYKIIPTTQRSIPAPIQSLPYKQQSDVNAYLPPKTPTYLPPKSNDLPIVTQKPYRPPVTSPPIYLPPTSRPTFKPVTFAPIYLPPKPIIQSNDYAITTRRPVTVRTTQRIIPTTQRAYLPPKGYLPPN